MFSKLTITATILSASMLFADLQGSDVNSCTKPSNCDLCFPTTCGYNWPAGVDVCGWNFFVEAEFIYWQPLAAGLDIGFTNPDGNTIAAVPNSGGDVLTMEFNFRPGFKVGAGFHTDYDNWDFYAQYTWFRQNSTTGDQIAPNAPVGGIIEPKTWLNTGFTTQGKGDWKLDLNLIDGEMGRMSYVIDKLTMRPFWGLRGGWIDQDYTVDYTVLGVVSTTRAKSDSWLVGPRAGLDTNWLLGNGWRLIGNAAGSICYSQVDLSYVSEDASDPSQTPASTSETKKVLSPNLEFAIGLGWGSYFMCNDYYFDFSVTYEFHEFYNQNLLFTQAEGLNVFRNSFVDLGVHGFNISASFDF